MYFHGIYYHYLLYQYPVLSPRLTILRQNEKQRKDRKHLLERFGFEPVHFLESSNSYSKQECITSCFSFGNVIIAYKHLPLPMLQLSVHEVGVPVIDVRQADYIIVKQDKLIKDIRRICSNKPIFYLTNKHNMVSIRKIARWKRCVNCGNIEYSVE